MFYHNLSCIKTWVVTFSVLSSFEFCYSLVFVTTWVVLHFELCHNFNHDKMQEVSQVEFCHNLGFITTCVLFQIEFCHNFSFVTIEVLSQFELCYIWWVVLQFELNLTLNLLASVISLKSKKGEKVTCVTCHVTPDKCLVTHDTCQMGEVNYHSKAYVPSFTSLGVRKGLKKWLIIHFFCG